MSDYSLMNPDHLKSEIHDLETELIPAAEKLEARLKDDCERVVEYFSDQFNDKNNDTIVLTREQADDVLKTMYEFKFNRYRYSSAMKFQLRVYKHLMKDRRWFTAAKYLKFLKK